jgi:hypothetical protein
VKEKRNRNACSRYSSRRLRATAQTKVSAPARIDFFSFLNQRAADWTFFGAGKFWTPLRRPRLDRQSSHLCKENQQDRLRWRALRFFHYVCYDKSRNERTNSYWRFIGGFARRACSQGQSRRTVRCMRILQSPCLQGFTLSC